MVIKYTFYIYKILILVFKFSFFPSLSSTAPTMCSYSLFECRLPHIHSRALQRSTALTVVWKSDSSQGSHSSVHELYFHLNQLSTNILDNYLLVPTACKACNVHNKSIRHFFNVLNRCFHYSYLLQFCCYQCDDSCGWLNWPTVTYRHASKSNGYNKRVDNLCHFIYLIYLQEYRKTKRKRHYFLFLCHLCHLHGNANK